MKGSRILLLFLALFTAAFALGLLVTAGRAAADAADPPQPFITLAVDTSGDMEAERDALAAAWALEFVLRSDETMGPVPADHCEIWHTCHLLTETYKLIPFRDRVAVPHGTNDDVQMGNWLFNLPLGDDGNCEDNALRALSLVARLTPQSYYTETGALLLSNSAPYGGRAALARTINLLARENVTVEPVSTGWCPDASLPPQVMDVLALGTGGLPAQFRAPSDSWLTGTLAIILSDMTSPDTIAVRIGGGADFADEIIIPADSTVDLLDIAVSSYVGPLQMEPSRSPAVGNLTVRVFDPDDNLANEALDGRSTLARPAPFALHAVACARSGGAHRGGAPCP